MLDILNCKFGLLVPPILQNNGAFSAYTYIDTADFGRLTVLMALGVTDAAVGSTATTTPPLIEECDTTNGSYTAVSSAALAAVLTATDDAKMAAISVNLHKSHKRYMRVQAPTAANGTTGANLAIIGILSEPAGIAPASATECGLKELVAV